MNSNCTPEDVAATTSVFKGGTHGGATETAAMRKYRTNQVTKVTRKKK